MGSREQSRTRIQTHRILRFHNIIREENGLCTEIDRKHEKLSEENARYFNFLYYYV